MTLPTFFIVGAPKAGTSSLYHYLNQHPDVYFPVRKETRFFSTGYEKGIDYYERTFFGNWDGESAAGEADVTYFARPYAARRIRRNVVEAKIIIVLRNPVDRAYSDYRMMHRKHGPLKGSFLDMLEANSKQLMDYERLKRRHTRIEDQEIAYDSVAWESEFLQNGHYVEHIERYESLFGVKNVKILFFEDLATDPTNLMNDVFAFLDLEPAEVCDMSIRNSDRPPVRAALRSVLGTRLADSSIDLIPRWIKKPLVGRLASVWRKPAVSDIETSWLVDYYRPWNEKLAASLKSRGSVPSWVTPRVAGNSSTQRTLSLQ